MAQKFTPHCVAIDAYTLPVAMRVLDSMPSPRALLKIPPPYHGRLMATLAHELSIVLKMLIYSRRRERALARKSSELFEDCTDLRFAKARDRHSALWEQERALENGLVDLERKALRLGAATTTISGPIKREVSPISRSFQWLEDGFLRPGELDRFKSEFEAAARHFRRVRTAQGKARQILARERQRVEASERYAPRSRAINWAGLSIDFSDEVDFQMEGAAFYLRNADYSWWEQFTRKAKARVSRDAARAPHRIALRDPEVVEKIENALGTSKSWDDAAVEVFRSEPSEWGVPPITSACIKGMRQQLRAADKWAFDWLERTGGPRHPFHRYREWKAEQEYRAVEILSGFDAQNTGNDPRWKAAARRARKIHRGWGDVDEALNELCWCLIEDHEDRLSFSPLTREGYSKADWERHRDTWWSAIKRAQQARLPK